MLERLFLILAVATLYLTGVSTAVVAQGWRRWVDTHWDRGISYLKTCPERSRRIGWSWVRQQARKGWRRFPPFQLDPEPDPEPAMSSRREAAKPGPAWTVRFNPP